MDTAEIAQLYDFTGQTILITGGAGVLCSDRAIAPGFILGAQNHYLLTDKER
jgi:hypothetical protein